MMMVVVNTPSHLMRGRAYILDAAGDWTHWLAEGGALPGGPHRQGRLECGNEVRLWRLELSKKGLFE
jgi:hypothetical protein